MTSFLVSMGRAIFLLLFFCVTIFFHQQPIHSTCRSHLFISYKRSLPYGFHCTKTTLCPFHFCSTVIIIDIDLYSGFLTFLALPMLFLFSWMSDNLASDRFMMFHAYFILLLLHYCINGLALFRFVMSPHAGFSFQWVYGIYRKSIRAWQFLHVFAQYNKST